MPNFIISTDDMLKFLGPVLTLLGLSFGLLQLYPKLLESSLKQSTGYSQELTRRLMKSTLIFLRVLISSLAISALSIVGYVPNATAAKEICAWPSWSDDVLAGL